MSLFEDGARPGFEDVARTIRPVLSRHFRPALLARMTVVPFAPLPRDVLREIVEMKLRGLARRLDESHRIATTFAPELLDALAARCTEAETGARNVEHVIRGSLMPRLSRALLEKLSAGEHPTRVAVGLDPAGDFTVELTS
jgi:type VI secretion system protein VasG